MIAAELIKIREEKKLSKSNFAKLLGVTPMLLGKYEKGICAIPESIAEKAQNVADAVTATEIEGKKTARKAGRKAKETAAKVVDAAADKALATGIEVKKNVRKAGKKVKETAGEIKKAAGIPNIIIQSPMGGIITPADITKKVPKGTTEVYVRVDENKLYYVLKNGETGDVDIW